MPPAKPELKFLWDMQQVCAELDERMRRISLEQYLEQRDLRLIVERLLIMLGDAARGVSAQFQLAHPEIPWRSIIGQRNLLTHSYDVVENEQLYWTCCDDIPLLLQQLRLLVPDLPAAP